MTTSERIQFLSSQIEEQNIIINQSQMFRSKLNEELKILRKVQAQLQWLERARSKPPLEAIPTVWKKIKILFSKNSSHEWNELVLLMREAKENLQKIKTISEQSIIPGVPEPESLLHARLYIFALTAAIESKEDVPEDIKSMATSVKNDLMNHITKVTKQESVLNS